ncbi:hypothetical protein H1W37_19445 [Stappia taiwanensis]|uniref:Uncharacterized protein n=1 Tax=Stappia taiwanensis TaxID=992267 RepID=A0A838XZ83_9HYPH|nr:hypothetical protein [Stappia taiwanensis]MBA4613838.1 hypothetical protein [Stappia taiwanensis]GGE79140.1 hypothetical protein GCM10007285_03700 [Stappia taiwanensis]
MGKVIQSLFGGGGDNGAREAAERSAQTQRVANDRQLAEANRADKKSGVSRRMARGKRLFEDGGKAALPSKLGNGGG